jgi:hypothetical protein
VENWQTEPWPLKDDTQSRTFSCSSLTWYKLIQKSSLDNWESLAVEVIAAHLNIISGVTCPDKIREDLESADNLLLNCTWSKAQTEEVKDLLSSLRDFNKEEEMNKIHNAKEQEDSAASEKTLNSNSPQLLLLILIPAIILVVAIIVVVVMFIKKKVEDKPSVTL